MKILRVASDIYPQVVGGIGLHVHEMSRLQAKYGNDVTVFTSQTNGKINHEFVQNYEIYRFRNNLKLFGNSLSLRFISHLIKCRKDYDLIHAHSHLFFSTNLCALLRKLGSSPLIITNHGLVSQTAPLWIQQIYMASIGKWTLQSADKVLCYTNIEKNQLVKYGIPADKIAVIHNGISTVDFTPSDRIKNKQLLWIGRFTPGKGVDVLIKAFKIFHDKFPDFTLVMIGRGPLMDEIRHMIKILELESSIELKDFVPNENLPKIYQNSYLFVLPSFEEGVPRTILEAMACEIPVVCTDLPQLRDIIQGCGIMIPARDPIALADALRRMVTDCEFAKTCGINGRGKVISQYSWDETVKETLIVYETVARSKNKKEIISDIQIESVSSGLPSHGGEK